jgi:hypothetical protein
VVVRPCRPAMMAKAKKNALPLARKLASKKAPARALASRHGSQTRVGLAVVEMPMQMGLVRRDAVHLN